MALQIPFLLLTFRGQGLIVACCGLKTVSVWLEVESRKSIFGGGEGSSEHQNMSEGTFWNLWSTEKCLLSVCLLTEAIKHKTLQ